MVNPLHDLGDHSALVIGEDFVEALKEGLKATQAQLNALNMTPSSYASRKQWFLQPWTVERSDSKHWAYVAPEKQVSGEDGDEEIMRDSITMQLEGNNVEHDGELIAPNVSAVDAESANIDDNMITVDSEDEKHILRVIEEECIDVILQMLYLTESGHSIQFTSRNPAHKIEPVVY
jgi:hypothetical protein